MSAFFLVAEARTAKGSRMLTLILGPVRSGKSARAAFLAHATRKRVVVAATAALDPADAAMRERVERHRRERPPYWTLVETAVADAPSLVALLRDASDDTCIVVDALGAWIAAQLLEWKAFAERDLTATLDALDAQGSALAEALAETRADAIVVAEETSWDVLPSSTLGRVARDALGRLSQAIAARSDRIEMVVAGFALDVRALGVPVDQV